jgi:hypothetical protein
MGRDDKCSKIWSNRRSATIGTVELRGDISITDPVNAGTVQEQGGDGRAASSRVAVKSVELQYVPQRTPDNAV